MDAIPEMNESHLQEPGLPYLSSIVKSADDGIVGTDLNGVIVCWNLSAERLFGYPEAEALGKHEAFLYPHDRRTECLDNIRRVGLRERPQRHESSRVRKDGSGFEVSVLVSPIENGCGELLGVSSTYREIAEHKRTDAALETAKRTAEMASRAKSEFLANMSHELRTPLNGIIGLTEVVLDSELTGEQRERIGLVKDAGYLLMGVLGDILDMAKIQSGKYLIQPKQFWIRDLLNSIVNEFAATAHEKNIQFTLKVQANVALIFLGDPDCLRQVLSNLVGNAIKFTPAGEVEVAVMSLTGDPGSLSFRVRDTGIGIPLDQQRIIFEPFSQVDNSLRRKFGGTGLGLAICAELTEIMGGEIWVKSDGRTGSTFCLTVRLDPVDATPENGGDRFGAQPEVPERRRELRLAANDWTD